MKDAIDRLIEAAEALADCRLSCGYAYFSCDNEWRDEVKALRAAIPAARAELEKGGWIPVDERLPEAPFKLYLCWNGGYVISRTRRECEAYPVYFIDHNITHWWDAELPAPPKETP